ncbi:MAG: HEPN domain-containing protein, partial [Chloroflexota bacterium]|nr:HEPN domain-containing protein [Chloroflexota bacterium]
SKKGQENRVHDATLAIQSADAFRELSKPFLDRVGNDIRVSHELAVRNLGGMIASATNLSLAVELYLKAIRILLNRDPTTDHDLSALFNGLPQSLKHSVVCEYEKLKALPAGSVASFELAIAPRVPGEEELRELNRSRPAQDNSLTSVLKRCRNAFRTWRYLHERGDSKRIVTFQYEFYFLGITAAALRIHAVDLAARQQAQSGAAMADTQQAPPGD